jgi:alpha-tubulin suppressor-like RCC1 family protein
MGTSSATPVEVATNAPGNAFLTGMTKVWVDGTNGYNACAINASGTTWCWGQGTYGALGNGSTASNSNFAIPVKTSAGGTQLTGVAQISVTGDHTCAVMTDHTLKCWGYNYYGEIGQGNDGSTYQYTFLYPTTVAALYNQVAQVSVSNDVSCAVDLSGGVWCWGYDAYGITGDGNHTGDAKVPVQVQSTPGDGGAPFGGVSQVQFGYYYYSACALVSADGSLWCWGNYSSSNGYVPIPYVQSSNQVTAVYKFCENGASSPSYVDYKGVFNYNGSPQTSTYQVTCP